MPNVRQRMVATLSHAYPFYVGCGTFANTRLVRWLSGESDQQVWARVRGGCLLVPLNDYIGRAAYFTGDLDPKVTWAVCKLLEQGNTVIDIGANYGLMSVLFASLVGHSGRVEAFEPIPTVCESLKKTIERNGLSQVTLYQHALGNSDGTLPLSVPMDHTGRASFTRIEPNSTLQQVPIRRLDQVIAELGIDKIDLLKIDVEGFESEVFAGSNHVLSQIRPRAILFEFNEPGVRFGESSVVRLLRDHGYGFIALPKRWIRMRGKKIDADAIEVPDAHDFVASPLGEIYEEVANRLKAS